MTVKAAAVILGLVLSMTMFSSCSFGGDSIGDSAVALIEGDMATNLGLNLTDAACDEPASEAVGTTFGCNALHDGLRVDVEVLIDREDHIVASTTNVVRADALAAIEATVVDSMNDQGDFGLTADALDCGETAVVLDQDQIFRCGLTEPGTTNVFDTSIRMNDLATLSFDFEVASEPRLAE